MLIPQKPRVIKASASLRQLFILLLDFSYQNTILPPLMKVVRAYTHVFQEPSIQPDQFSFLLWVHTIEAVMFTRLSVARDHVPCYSLVEIVGGFNRLARSAIKDMKWPGVLLAFYAAIPSIVAGRTSFGGWFITYGTVVGGVH